MGGQQLGSAGVRLVMEAIFHKALLAGLEGGVVNCTGGLWMCVTCPSCYPLLTGNGRSFSSLFGCLVYQTELSPISSSPETMALAEQEGALWRCRRTALQSRSSSTIRSTSISVPKSNFELTARHTRYLPYR